ncbi:hypothetical protein BH160DRAFT_1323 [Burkholderia sp. H160]|nr:hypothetical protein BH160DRAFT_1323 [Burkholderia sp. H160]
MIHLHTARFPEQLEVVRGIFREYAESLGIDLGVFNPFPDAIFLECDLTRRSSM